MFLVSLTYIVPNGRDYDLKIASFPGFTKCRFLKFNADFLQGIIDTNLNSAPNNNFEFLRIKMSP